MRLNQFEVSRFRNVLDSTPVQVEPDVTCLVGKNESGKTAMLEALYRLNPVYSAKFDSHDDYPRWRVVQDRRKGLVDDARPISATFAVEEQDKKAVEAVLGSGALLIDEFTVTRVYGVPDQLNYLALSETAVDEAAALAHVVDALDLSDAAAGHLRGVVGLNGLGSASAEAAAAVAAQEDAEPSLVAELKAAAAKAEELTAKGGFTGIASAVLLARIPRFFYFTNYHLLEGRLDLNELAATSDEEPAASPRQTARSLLRLAETTPQALMGDQYERRKAELEAVSNDLTRQVLVYWRQNPDLRVEFDVDRDIRPSRQHGQQIVGHSLEVRVEDRRHEFTNSFSQRSSGFRWFFSFLAAFTEFEEGDSDVVVLLDEPALTLHGKAQADFLRFISDRLAPVAQVIYTTHSPFLVETDRIDRVRVVEDHGPEKGSVASGEAMTVSDDTLFPLQAALGYDVAQNLFVGDTNLLVEGSSDFVYLDVIGRHLREQKRAGLDPRWRILPAGGSGNIPAFVTLLGRKVQVTVLVDSGTEGTGRLQNAITAGRLSASRLVSVSEITGGKYGDIEDLFDERDYLRLYNKAFSAKIKPSDLPPGDRIIKRIEQKTGANFDHWQPARTLLSGQEELLPQMAPATFDAFEQLNTRINATLGA